MIKLLVIDLAQKRSQCCFSSRWRRFFIELRPTKTQNRLWVPLSIWKEKKLSLKKSRHTPRKFGLEEKVTLRPDKFDDCVRTKISEIDIENVLEQHQC